MDQFISSLVLHLDMAENEEGEDPYLKELVSLVPTMTFQPSMEEDVPDQRPQSEAIISRPVPRRDQRSSSALFSSTTTRQEKDELFSEDRPILRTGPQALRSSRGMSCPDMSSELKVMHGGPKARRGRRSTVHLTPKRNGDEGDRQRSDSARFGAKFERASFRSVFEECMLKP